MTEKKATAQASSMPDPSTVRDRKADKYGDSRFVKSYYATKHAAGGGRLRHLLERRWLEQHLVGLVLDCGIGTGRFLEGLLSRGHEVVGVDLSAAMLRYLRESWGPSDLRLVRSDLGALPLKTKSVDSVMSIRVLFHLPNYREVLRELIRVTKTGGRVVFDVRSGEHVALCQRLARRLRLPRIPGEAVPSNPVDYSVAVHLAEIRELTREVGGRLVDSRPYDFLSTYWVCAIPGFSRVASSLLSVGWILRSWMWVEALLSKMLPPALLSRHFVVLEKEPDNQ